MRLPLRCWAKDCGSVDSRAIPLSSDALIGAGTGMLGALGFGKMLSSLVYGVSIHDAATFAGVAIVLIIVTLAACAIPARRDARVDPMVAIRLD